MCAPFVPLVNCVVYPDTMKKLQLAFFNLTLASSHVLLELFLKMIKKDDRTYRIKGKLFNMLFFSFFFLRERNSHSENRATRKIKKKKDHIFMLVTSHTDAEVTVFQSEHYFKGVFLG